MSAEALFDDGWTLETSTVADIDQLMDWSPNEEDINIWRDSS